MPDDALIARLLSGYDPSPFPTYAELRESGSGVHRVASVRGWMAFRHADVVRVTRDHSVFSNDMFWSAPAAAIHDPHDPGHARFVDISSRQMIFRDPPAHTRLRNLVRGAFTPSRITAMRPVVERVVEQTLDRFRPGQRVEFVGEIADDVPVAVIAAALGVPASDRGRFREWSTALSRTFEPTTDWAQRDRDIATSNELVDYLGRLVERRRADPADDLITAVALAADENGRHIADNDLLAQLTLVLVAGNETTASLLGNGVSLLLAHPWLRAELARAPHRWAAAVEEMLRMAPPLHINVRVTTDATRLGDVDVAPGTVVMVANGAANRDPRVFASPDTFSLDREPNPHTSFNRGIHFCVGAALARVEGEVLLRALLARFPAVAAGEESPSPRPNAIARGWATLPVVL